MSRILKEIGWIIFYIVCAVILLAVGFGIGYLYRMMQEVTTTPNPPITPTIILPTQPATHLPREIIIGWGERPQGLVPFASPPEITFVDSDTIKVTTGFECVWGPVAPFKVVFYVNDDQQVGDIICGAGLEPGEVFNVEKEIDIPGDSQSLHIKIKAFLE